MAEKLRKALSAIPSDNGPNKLTHGPIGQQTSQEVMGRNRASQRRCKVGGSQWRRGHGRGGVEIEGQRWSCPMRTYRELATSGESFNADQISLAGGEVRRGGAWLKMMLLISDKKKLLVSSQYVLSAGLHVIQTSTHSSLVARYASTQGTYIAHYLSVAAHQIRPISR